MAYTFTRTGAQIEEIHNTVEDPKSNAQFSDDIRAIAGEYRGLWPDTGGSANKGDTYQTQVSGTPTGQYFTALQNTTVDPVGDDVNWKAVVGEINVNSGDSQLAGGAIWPLSSRDSAKIGDDLTGYGFVRLIGGDFSSIELFRILGDASGTLTSFDLTPPYSCIIGGEQFYLAVDSVAFNNDGFVLNSIGASPLLPDNSDIVQPFMSLIESGFIGSSLTFLPGTYQFSKCLRFYQSCVFTGPSGSTFSYGNVYPVKLRWSSGVTGVFVLRSDTDATDTGSPIYPATDRPLGGGDQTIIKNLDLSTNLGIRPPAAGNHGIRFNARTIIRDCSITNFEGDGIHSVANATSTDENLRGNANVFTFETVRCSGNGGNGIYVNGADVNAGYGSNLDCTGNQGWGVYDSSFLGNTWVGLHTDNNQTGPYITDNANATSVFVGAYVEQNQNDAQLAPRSLSLGGLHGAKGPSTGHIDVNNGIAQSNGFITDDEKTGGDVIAVAIGGNSNFGAILRYSDTEFANGTAYLRQLPSGGQIVWDVNGAVNNRTFEMETQTTTNSFGRVDPVPFAFKPLKLVVGSRIMSNSIGEPTTGQFARGEVVYEQNTSAGGKVGRSVTTGGTAGVDAVFKEFGNIDN